MSPAGERVESVGGDALFAALAARLAGGNPTILAPLGTDATPALLAAIRSAGTDPATLPRRDLPTVRNVVRYDDAGGRVWDLVLGEAHFEALSVHPADVSDAALAAPGVLLSAMALHAQLELAAWLRARTAATIYFDPQEDYIAGHEAALLDAVAACDVFLPSEIEAAALAGTADLHAAAATFLRARAPDGRHQTRRGRMPGGNPRAPRTYCGANGCRRTGGQHRRRRRVLRGVRRRASAQR